MDPIQKSAQAQFEKQSANYGKTHILADTSDVQRALTHVSLEKGARALDVAAGGGHTGALLGTLGCQVVLSDLSRSMLRQARRLAEERHLHVATLQHSAEKMPYAPESFHLATCRVAAHHFTSPAEFVTETARVLKPSGFFVLIDGSVEDNEPEAEAWIHMIEKLRDPSHNRFLTPGSWKLLCLDAGLQVRHCILEPFKQPDLDWYFETASTPEANRLRVREEIKNAPTSAHRVFRLAEENGKIVWWWPRLILVAQKLAANSI